MIGSPLYLLMAIDAFGVNLSNDYIRLLPLWLDVIGSTVFVIGFVLFFTTREEKQQVRTDT